MIAAIALSGIVPPEFSRVPWGSIDESSLISVAMTHMEAGAHDDLKSLITRILAADYQGNREALAALDLQMAQFAPQSADAGYALYWRGYARWRRALITLALPEPDANAVAADLWLAEASFRESRQLRPTDVEPSIALASVLLSAAAYARQTPDDATRYRAEARGLLAEVRLVQPANPRLIFVEAATLFWTPAAYGGDRNKAVDLVRNALDRRDTWPRSADGLGPTWGEPELHMQMAYFLAQLGSDANDRARVHALAALRLRPDWRYVRDVLLPQLSP